MKTNTCLLVAALFISGLAAAAEKKAAAKAAPKPAVKVAAKPAARSATEIALETTGVVKDSRVNLRGQPTLNSEVVTQLKKGESVTVLGEVLAANAKKDEPSRWLKIALPANTPVWVNALFVTNNTVVPNKLNVRGGPGENFSVLARLEKGAAVKSLRTANGWLEIESPANAIAFVAADHITLQPAAPTAVLATTKLPPASVPTPVPAPAPLETVKLTNAPPVVTVPVPAPTRTPATIPSVLPAPTPVVVTNVAALTPAPVPAAVVEPTPVEPTAAPAPAKAATPEKSKGFWATLFGSDKKPAAAKPAEAAQKVATIIDTDPGPPRVITREGIVRRAYNIQAPSDWELEDSATGKTINYLQTSVTNIPWKTLRGRLVVVTGEEAIDKRWPSTPLIKIETLKTLP